MALRAGVAPSTTTCHSPSPFFPSSSSSSSYVVGLCSAPFSCNRPSDITFKCSYSYPSLSKKAQSIPLSLSSFTKQICRAAEYKFPDPIPEFANAETLKFRTHLHEKLVKKDVCGDSVGEVVEICAGIFSEFLHTHYGGPGTLLVLPFIDMADTVNERGLPGGPQAARAAVKWAQNCVDKDWKEWTGDSY
ncbi:protein PLASTID REDOX INSENSITIVE 2, chloroplastic [Corylus avellana]|uniref:protein PLASTID REDOX INSENSITIVE 2, chloroplastic n=1 Tax=Corylus avellana TaxID=13451 RepID=UPI00286AB5D6|nr:protein PLASTID REDOX INSENSITIVE 2, chloroplastic [Corylus avellana]